MKIQLMAKECALSTGNLIWGSTPNNSVDRITNLLHIEVVNVLYNTGHLVFMSSKTLTHLKSFRVGRETFLASGLPK